MNCSSIHKSNPGALGPHNKWDNLMTETYTIELTRRELVTVLNDTRRNLDRSFRNAERHDAIEKLENALPLTSIPGETAVLTSPLLVGEGKVLVRS